MNNKQHFNTYAELVRTAINLATFLLVLIKL